MSTNAKMSPWAFWAVFAATALLNIGFVGWVDGFIQSRSGHTSDGTARILDLVAVGLIAVVVFTLRIRSSGRDGGLMTALICPSAPTGLFLVLELTRLL